MDSDISRKPEPNPHAYRDDCILNLKAVLYPYHSLWGVGDEAFRLGEKIYSEDSF